MSRVHPPATSAQIPPSPSEQTPAWHVYGTRQRLICPSGVHSVPSATQTAPHAPETGSQTPDEQSSSAPHSLWAQQPLSRTAPAARCISSSEGLTEARVYPPAPSGLQIDTAGGLPRRAADAGAADRSAPAAAATAPRCRNRRRFERVAKDRTRSSKVRPSNESSLTRFAAAGSRQQGLIVRYAVVHYPIHRSHVSGQRILAGKR